MSKQSYQFIVRLIRMMANTFKTQDIERLYYGHNVHCYRHCNLMMLIEVYKTDKKEDGILTAFTYFFGTKELCFTEPVDSTLSEVVISTFKGLYHSIMVFDEKTISGILEQGNSFQDSFLHYDNLLEYERQEGHYLSFSLFKGIGREAGTYLSFAFYYITNELCFEVPHKGALQNMIEYHFKRNHNATVCSKPTPFQQNGMVMLPPSLRM